MEHRPRPPRPNPLPEPPKQPGPSPDSATASDPETGWERYLSVLVPASDGRADDGDMPARTRPHGPRLDVLSEAWVREYRTRAAVRQNLTGHVLGAEVEQHLTGVAA